MTIHHKVRAVPDLEQPDKGEIFHFSLKGLLPENYSLALCTMWGTLSLLVCKDGFSHMLNQQHFTASEISLTVLLLQYFPYYCPHEVLYASFQYGNVSEKAVSDSREYLREAKAAGIWDQEVHSLRCALSRARLKLHDFGIEVTSLYETGYLLRKHT